MFPKWHIFLGGLFTLIIWIFAPNLNPIYLAIIFLSSFLIDFDHFVVGAARTGKLNFKEIYDYHEQQDRIKIKERTRGIRKKGDFHLFHTIEFHVLIGILGIFFAPLFYVFIGMIFHSLIDLFSLIQGDEIYRREYFFFNWIRKRFD